MCDKKDEVFPVHLMKAYRGSRGLDPFILNFATRWVNGQFHVPVALSPEKNPFTR
jgi:hypothetical protein